MKILALDIATTTGFALGKAGAIPRSGSVRLKKPGEPPEIAAWNLRCFLRDQFVLDRPDLAVVEHFLHPIGQKSGDAVILQLMCVGAALAELIGSQVRYEMPHASTVRKHFIGAANMGDRAKTKAAVVRRAQALGYVDRDCRDTDRADACALWDWACATYCNFRPEKLVLFGEMNA